MSNFHSAQTILQYLNSKNKQLLKEKEEITSYFTSKHKTFNQTFRTKRQLSKSTSNLKYQKREVLGMMEKNVYSNMDQYRQIAKYQKKYKEIDLMMTLVKKQVSPLKIKPNVNYKSQKLFEKRKKQQNLSPNVFQRLQKDQENRSKDKICKTIMRIKEVTPTKRLNKTDLLSFATPKEFKQLRYIFPEQTK